MIQNETPQDELTLLVQYVPNQNAHPGTSCFTYNDTYSFKDTPANRKKLIAFAEKFKKDAKTKTLSEMKNKYHEKDILDNCFEWFSYADMETDYLAQPLFLSVTFVKDGIPCMVYSSGPIGW